MSAPVSRQNALHLTVVATTTSRKPYQLYPEKLSEPLILPGGLVG